MKNKLKPFLKLCGILLLLSIILLNSNSSSAFTPITRDSISISTHSLKFNKMILAYGNWVSNSIRCNSQISQYFVVEYHCFQYSGSLTGKVMVDWGDGKVSITPIYPDGKTTSGHWGPVSHTYAITETSPRSTYLVTAKLIDNNDNVLASATTRITP